MKGEQVESFEVPELAFLCQKLYHHSSSKVALGGSGPLGSELELHLVGSLALRLLFFDLFGGAIAHGPPLAATTAPLGLSEVQLLLLEKF